MRESVQLCCVPTTLTLTLFAHTAAFHYPHLCSIPHKRSPGVSQFVSARPFIIMPQEDITLQLQNVHKTALQLVRAFTHYIKI